MLSMLPVRNSDWWHLLLQALVASPAYKTTLDDLMQECYANNEFASISIDGTFRLCFPLLGQPRFDVPRRLRGKQAIPYQDAMHRVITVKGMTSCVLAVDLTRNEEPAELSALLTKRFPARYRQQIRHVAVDAPSASLLANLRRCCPRLQYVSLDPTHVIMHYEAAQGNKRSQGSTWLRLAMGKLSKVDDRLDGDAWGVIYQGRQLQATPLEETSLNKLRSGSMEAHQATAQLEKLRGSKDPSRGGGCPCGEG